MGHFILINGDGQFNKLDFSTFDDTHMKKIILLNTSPSWIKDGFRKEIQKNGV